MLTGSITIQDRTQNIAERADISELQRLVRIDQDGVHVGDNIYRSEVLIDSESIDMRIDGQTFSTYGIDHTDMGEYRIASSSDGGLSFNYLGGGLA